MSLLKIPLNVLVLTYHCISTTSPNPPPRKGEVARVPESLSLRLVRSTRLLTYLSSNLVLAFVMLADILVNWAQNYPEKAWAPGIYQFFSAESLEGQTTKIYTSPAFLTGVAFVCIGTWIRVACYRELGRFFTYVLAVRDKHTLVTTGPYAIVRHPAYTAGMMVKVGVMACIFSRGSWWMESERASEWSGKVVAVVWGYTTIRSFFVYSRAGKEDRMLKKAFGKEWTEWANAVPYKYVPGVL